MSIPLFSNSTQGELNATSTPARLALLTEPATYTVNLNCVNLIGQVSIDASTVSVPQVGDWETVDQTTIANNVSSFNMSFTGPGNYTFLRARLDRNYLNLVSPTQDQINALGYISNAALTTVECYGQNIIDIIANSSVGSVAITISELGIGDGIISNATTFDGVTSINVKSIAVGAGLNLYDDGQTITISANASGLGAPSTFSANASPLTVGASLLVGQSNVWNVANVSTVGQATSPLINVKLAPYNAKGTAKEILDLTTTYGSTTITSASGPFNQEDVGKSMWIANGGPSNSILATTITAVSNSTTATIANAAGSNNTQRAIWGFDDTAAIQQALNDAAAQPGEYGKTVFLPAGRYMCGPLTISARMHLMGAGPRVSQLMTTPGTANDAWQISNENATDDFIYMSDFCIYGVGYFQQTSGTPNYIGGILFDGGTAQDQYVDCYHRWSNIDIFEVSGIGLYYKGRGETYLTNFGIFNSGLQGMFFDGQDAVLVACNVGGSGLSGIVAASSSGSCRFTNCKSYYNGQNINGSRPSGSYSAFTTANIQYDPCVNWWLQCSNNIFSQCEGQECPGDNWLIQGLARTNQLIGCKASDTGDTSVLGYVGGSVPSRRAALVIEAGCIDHVIRDFMVNNGVNYNGATNAFNNYATHALYIDNTYGALAYCTGSIYIESTALTGQTSPANNITNSTIIGSLGNSVSITLNGSTI